MKQEDVMEAVELLYISIFPNELWAEERIFFELLEGIEE